MPAEDIIKVYDRIKRDSLDLVTTYRVNRCDGFSRIIISRIYNLLFKILFPGPGVRDVNSKPKIFSKTALEKMRLTSDDWFIDAEIIIKARKMRLRRGEVPTDFYKCGYRKSFVKTGAIFEFLKNLSFAKMKDIF